MKRLAMISLLGLTAVNASAVEQWSPSPGEGSLTFTAEQQGAPFEGLFREFTANFELDPDAVEDARIEATIVMDSVDTLYDERDEYLRQAEWFDVERWPTARFVTQSIQATDDGYLADALLTLRDQTRSVAMAFKLEGLDDGRLRFTARSDVQRLDFGVGQGQWTNTDWVGNDVTINVVLVLEPSLP